MDSRSEKILIILMALSVVILIFLNFGGSADASDGDYNNEGLVGSYGLINEYPGIMRLHVVANSDSVEDQDLKAQVRDYVLSELEKNLSQLPSMQEAALSPDSAISDEALSDSREYIQNHLELIESLAKEKIVSEGYDYDVTAAVAIRHIPAKYYDDILFPEGNYEALTITIGEGRGQNWWCVVFPPLCLIDSSQQEESSAVSDELSQPVLKFKTKEILDNAGSEISSSVFSEAICDAFSEFRNYCQFPS